MPLLLNKYFDFAALHPEVTQADIEKLCAEAVTFDFFAVCVNPVWVETAVKSLSGTNVKVASVAGFPLGASQTSVKAIEAAEAAQLGAHEIDMVANIGWLCSNRYVEAEAEIRKVRRNLPDGVLLKVIIECGKLSPIQQHEATRTVLNAGAQMVKTGTGFFGGADPETVKRLALSAAGQIGVKASGGIKTLEQCRQLIEAGAIRLGSSSCPAIMRENSSKPIG
ncbi:MAG: deoxyribose-phosphate aldolase [Candidatus Zixiibacteriota bacterium]